MDMNFALEAVNYSTASLQADVGTKVLSKAMDQMEATGAGLIQMMDAAAMERSVNPAVGGNFDVTL